MRYTGFESRKRNLARQQMNLTHKFLFKKIPQLTRQLIVSDAIQVGFGRGWQNTASGFVQFVILYKLFQTFR